MNDDQPKKDLGNGGQAPPAGAAAGSAQQTAAQRQAQIWRDNAEAVRLQVSKDEVSWIERYETPSSSVDVALVLGCGNQTIPHLMLLQIKLFERLGLNFVATSGPQFCCGIGFARNGLPAAADHLAGTSIKRLASFNAPTHVQNCGSCFIQFDEHVGRIREETGTAPFEVVHYTKFLRDWLIAQGDAVPWVRTRPRRVLLHTDGTEIHVSKEHQRDWVIETLGMIPGVEYVGQVNAPSLGKPCASNGPGTPSVLHDVTSEQYRQVQAELEAQAREAGADAIVTNHHVCQREWGKFSSPRLPIIHYLSLVAEALGVHMVDRFKALWQLGDPEKILERSRPQWGSWGISEGDARELVKKFFVPRYAEAIHRCPCEGSCGLADLRGGEDPCLVTSR